MSTLAFTESWSVWHSNPLPQTYHFEVQRFALCYSLPVRSSCAAVGLGNARRKTSAITVIVTSLFTIPSLGLIEASVFLKSNAVVKPSPSPSIARMNLISRSPICLSQV